jgi:hypothetical protein
MRTPEQDQDERETAGFAARTVIDDTIGKLMFIRHRILMDAPLSLQGHLHDAEAAVEAAIDDTMELPEQPPDWRARRPSASECLGEACSCGQPDWVWDPSQRLSGS